MVSRKVILEFNALFAEENYNDYCQRISEIPQQFLYDFASTYLRFKTSDEKVSNLQTLLGTWFRKENEIYANEIYKSILKLEQQNGYKYLIINELTNLLIFEASLNSQKKELEITESELEILFFKIYLAFNQKTTENEHLAGESTEDLKFPYRIYALLLSQTLNYGDISNYNLKESVITQSAKAIIFFEFISANKEFANHLDEFNKYYNVKDHIEFLKEYLGLLFLILRSKDEGKIDISIPAGNEYDRRELFFNEIAITEPYSSLDTDFKLLRSYPLIKVKERKYRIISPLFTIEKFYNGLYFKFKDINDSISEELRIKDIRAELTYRFSEKHLLYDILKRCYDNKFIQKTGEEITRSGNDGFVDYYLRNGNKVFLFESKDILINAQIKQSQDFDRIEPELKKKLYYEEKNGKKELKAIFQLIESIKTLLDGNFNCDNQYKPNSIRIYPIIILHNKQLETLGINQIIRQWWRDEIITLKAQSYNTVNIKGAVILNIDTLILQSDNIRLNKIKLENIIDGYLNEIDQDRLMKKKFESEEARKSAFQNACIPFSDYFYHNTSWKLPSIFEEKGLTLFREEQN